MTQGRLPGSSLRQRNGQNQRSPGSINNRTPDKEVEVSVVAELRETETKVVDREEKTEDLV